MPPASKEKARTTTATTGKEPYRRAAPTSSDKENEAEDDEKAYASSVHEIFPSALPNTHPSTHDASASAELEAARRNFAGVDEWGLEVESVEWEEGRSSSQAWR